MKLWAEWELETFLNWLLQKIRRSNLRAEILTKVKTSDSYLIITAHIDNRWTALHWWKRSSSTRTTILKIAMRLSSKSWRTIEWEARRYPEIIFPGVKSDSSGSNDAKELLMDDDTSRWCAAAADWWCYSYRVLLKGLPTTTCYLRCSRGDSHTNMPAYTYALAMVRVRGERGFGGGGEDTMLFDYRRYQMLLNRGLLCRVWTFVSLVKFHHGSSTLRSNLSSCGLSGIPPGNLESRFPAKPNDRFTLCEID